MSTSSSLTAGKAESETYQPPAWFAGHSANAAEKRLALAGIRTCKSGSQKKSMHRQYRCTRQVQHFSSIFFLDNKPTDERGLGSAPEQNKTLRLRQSKANRRVRAVGSSTWDRLRRRTRYSVLIQVLEVPGGEASNHHPACAERHLA